MLLAIDVGNTNLKLAFFSGDQVAATERLMTDQCRTASDLGEGISSALRQHGIDGSAIDGVVYCSVVPPIAAMLEQAIPERFGNTPLNVTHETSTGIRLLVDEPNMLGADRIVNGAAAYGLHSGPAIVIDLGTATTFDVVTADGCFLGGVIAPGIELAAQALTARAAQLPDIELAFPDAVIGSNTVLAMRSGVMYGYIGLVEGIIRRIKAERNEEFQVIATGGLAETVAKRTDVIDSIEPELTLRGLKLIWDMNQPS